MLFLNAQGMFWCEGNALVGPVHLVRNRGYWEVCARIWYTNAIHVFKRVCICRKGTGVLWIHIYKLCFLPCTISTKQLKELYLVLCIFL